MVDISNKRLNELKKGFEGKRIEVIGDMMLDGYFWGDVKRISPEAPVPVLEVEDEFFPLLVVQQTLHIIFLHSEEFPFRLE